jgi:hypothetical protein
MVRKISANLSINAPTPETLARKESVEFWIIMSLFTIIIAGLCIFLDQYMKN